MSDYDDKINAENIDNTPLGNLYNRFQDFKEINEKTKSKSKHVVIAISISIILFGALFFYLGFYNQASDTVFAPEKPPNDLQEKYKIGQLGDDHAHAALAIFINENKIDFAQEQFQLKSKYIHFENNNPYLIHRHATGVTLEMLFDSMGIKLTQDCIILSYERSYCNNDTHTIKLFVNKLEFSDISSYVPNHNDRILVSYSEKPYNSIQQLSYLESLEIYNIPKNQNSDNYTSV